MRRDKKLRIIGLVLIAVGVILSVAFPKAAVLFTTEWFSPTAAGFSCVFGAIALILGFFPKLLDRIPFLREQTPAPQQEKKK